MSAFEFLQVHTHDLEPDPTPDETTNADHSEDMADPEPPDTLLINASKGSRPAPLPPGDIRCVLSKNSKRSVKMTHIEYKVSYHKASSGQTLSLIDRGANGGGAGRDVRVVFKTGQTVDIRGIDNHQCTNIDIGNWNSWWSNPNLERPRHWYYATICLAQQRVPHTFTMSICMV
jgi:hypothetical protein